MKRYNDIVEYPEFDEYTAHCVTAHILGTKAQSKFMYDLGDKILYYCVNILFIFTIFRFGLELLN